MENPFRGIGARCAITLLGEGADPLAFCPAGDRGRGTRGCGNERDTIGANTCGIAVAIIVVSVGNGDVVLMIGGH